MSSEGVDLKKRRFLTATTSVIGAVGAGFAAVPFVANWQPSARAKAAGAPEEANLSGLEEGGLLRVKWRGKVCWVVHRTEEMIKDLASLRRQTWLTQHLLFHSSLLIAPMQHVLLKISTWVAIGICTHLGCSPTFRPEVAPADLGGDWKGGFYCPCHGSKFDLAGRVYAGVPAPTNLVIPPHMYKSDDVIMIGVDGGAA